MEICKIGDSPLFPNSPISELNPCVMGQPPYTSYVPDSYKDDFTVPERAFELPEVLLGSGRKTSSQADANQPTSTNKLMTLVKKGLILLLATGVLLGGLYFAKTKIFTKA